MQEETSRPKNANAMTIAYIEKLTNKELYDLFASISSQFASRLTDCKEVDDLKTLQAYLQLISGEIKVRDLPQGPR